MTEHESTILQASAVAIDGRALVIEGPPGSGKSSLALGLIERGAELIGDDGVTLDRRGERIFASPPPNITSLIEVHGVGIVEHPVAEPTPLALILILDGIPIRLPEALASRTVLGVDIPVLPFEPGTIAPVARAKAALNVHGLRMA
ncbi:HPr kinase/phosphorylase [Erythrobacter sp. THAF29]|uniref:HPr kinase/phosphorylase n=1 Tax=Erythrobacter sp. THAF29 TaxID=2587851 RepID=UPI0012A8C063|nr:serine kinase [Erythrobacter sp. THAF29]QFT77132.1 HPr kinase/phosphorylase [Erythrobacter sp. THAF29]